MVRLLVTYMEQLEEPAGPLLPMPTADISVRRESPQLSEYLSLYRSVGEPLQWDLRVPLDELAEFLLSPATGLYILRDKAHPIGLCEFVELGAPDVELTHFGLVPAAQGKRFGPYLLDVGLRSAWAHKARRVWLHTDTNDHPKAKATYERAGFKVFAEKFEEFPD